LTLGIRDDYFAPYYAAGGTQSEGNFWFGGGGNTASGSAYYVAHSGCSTTVSSYFTKLMASDNIPIICQPNNAANTTPKFNWAPHIGIAYRVRPNLVVRLGGNIEYGAFDSVGYGGTLGTNYPFRISVQKRPAELVFASAACQRRDRDDGEHLCRGEYDQPERIHPSGLAANLLQTVQRKNSVRGVHECRGAVAVHRS